MSGLISVLFVVILSYTLVKRFKNITPDARNSSGGQRPAGPARPRGYTNYKPHKDITSVSRDMGDRGNSVLRDDKNNDWLAQQLREEHRAFKVTSEMFDLKIEHAHHCDAKLLEQFHRRNCDAAGVDLGNGSTVRRKA